MADDTRQYIRAAQEAELRGDKGQAVELLAKRASASTWSGRLKR